jgi:dihydrofolate reductase
MSDQLPRAEYYCAATLDGFIAEADDTLEWLTGYEGSYDGPDAEPMKGSYDRYYETVGALVMGSKTYEFIIDHMGAGGSWPYPGKPTWVLTSREPALPEGEGVDVRLAGGSVAELGPEMLEAAGEKVLWVVGGGNVASQFAAADLLDRVIVTVAPVVLGTGKPLFEERLSGGPMRLLGSRAFDSGMVEVVYTIN